MASPFPPRRAAELAWYNPATRRRQTPRLNHVAQIEQRLARTPAADDALIPLNYALAKEHADLGEHAAAFAALARGAGARRRRLQYRVADDLDTLERIDQPFDAGYLPRGHPGPDTHTPPTRE